MGPTCLSPIELLECLIGHVSFKVLSHNRLTKLQVICTYNYTRS
jgi:hypothetical protein